MTKKADEVYTMATVDNMRGVFAYEGEKVFDFYIDSIEAATAHPGETIGTCTVEMGLEEYVEAEFGKDERMLSIITGLYNDADKLSEDLAEQFTKKEYDIEAFEENVVKVAGMEVYIHLNDGYVEGNFSSTIEFK